VLCTLKDTAGKPIEGCKIDIWEADSTGHYDVQHADHQGPDGRCVMHSDAEGNFWFKAIVPVAYPIPHDGPVGALLKKLHRHPWRPAHMHFMFEKKGYDHLIT
jgi:protocatechuate 3,4-dioxygenase beta subunit